MAFGSSVQNSTPEAARAVDWTSAESGGGASGQRRRLRQAARREVGSEEAEGVVGEHSGDLVAGVAAVSQDRCQPPEIGDGGEFARGLVGAKPPSRSLPTAT